MSLIGIAVAYASHRSANGPSHRDALTGDFAASPMVHGEATPHGVSPMVHGERTAFGASPMFQEEATSYEATYGESPMFQGEAMAFSAKQAPRDVARRQVNV